jgi:abortive infection bacteriophage resistance protein
MRYEKDHLGIEMQVARLVERGMQGDPAFIAEKLSAANYHRLTAFWHPFRGDGDTFKSNTQFTDIWRRYTFDRRLRLLILDAIERFEVALRTQFAYYHSRHFGPFGYFENDSSLPKFDQEKRRDFKGKIRKILNPGGDKPLRDPYLIHFKEKYGDLHPVPPVWAAVDHIDFGTLMHMHLGATNSVKKPVSKLFGIPGAVLESWLPALHSVRNICAHHERIWNRVLGIRLHELPIERFPGWHAPHKVDMGRTYGLLLACDLIVTKIAPLSKWRCRLHELLESYPEIPRAEMGFPDNCLNPRAPAPLLIDEHQ